MTTDLPFARHAVIPVVARPPILQALAVAAIVIRVLSFIASLLTAAYGAGVYVNSNAARDRLLRGAPADLPVSSPQQTILLSVPLTTGIGPSGLEEAQRATIVEAVAQRVEMTPAQAKQLDALLSESGADIFAISRGQPVATDAVFQALGDRFGRLPSTADGTEPFYFETPAGRAEIYDDRALFYQRNRLSPVRVVAGRRTNASGHPILLPADVNALVRLAQNACGTTSSRAAMLTDPQVEKLRSILSDPQQKLIALNATPAGDVVGINGASARPDGYATVDFAGGAVLFGPQGNLILRHDRDEIPAVSGTACALVICEGLFSVGLAVFLVLLGVRLARQPRERLARIVRWSWIKATASLIAGAAIGWTVESSLSASSATQGTTVPPLPVAFASGAAVAVLGVALPIVVLGVARRKAVREFYHPTA